MKRQLFCRLLFIIAVSITLFSCMHDEMISSADQPTSRDYASKSPWKEDQVYIKKAQQVFLQNANVTYFEKKYGKVHWDYAMSLGTFDESYLVVPILKDNEVVTVMKVYRIDDRVYFHEKNDPEFIDFFSDVMFKNIIDTEEKILYNDTSAESKTLIFKCTYRTISIGCPEGYNDCGYVPGRTISECKWTESGDNGIPPMQLCDPMECGGGGGGGAGPDPGFEYPDPPKDPCEELKTQNTNTNYKAKIQELDKSSVLNQKKETGYSESKSGGFTKLQQGTSTDSSNSLQVPVSSDTKGYIHTHTNEYEDGEDKNGNIRIKTPIKMFSPADVNTLMTMAGFVNGDDYSDLYGTMVSSAGNYTIKFTGTSTDVVTGFDADFCREHYLTYFKRNSTRSKEYNFLKFMKDEMGVKGVKLYKIKSNGKAIEYTLSENGRRVEKTDCPD